MQTRIKPRCYGRHATTGKRAALPRHREERNDAAIS